LRILHVITDLNTGGVPLHLLGLASYLKQGGDSVTVVSLSPPGPVTVRLEEAGVSTLACHAAGPWDWRVIERLASIIHELQPEVVHSLLFHANIAARFAGLLAGFDRRRLICEIQTVEIERRWHLPVDRLSQGLCRWLVGNSPSVIEHLAQRAGISRSRLRLIWGGVDADRLASAVPVARSTLGLSDQTPLLLWVGRLDPAKGLDVLVEAAAILNRTDAVNLAIVGDGAYRKELTGLIARHQLSERVRLLGTRSDVAGLLKAADVFVFPSRTEGLPNALLEAMAAALPVVTTAAPGCRDLIETGRTGLVVPVDDAAALASAVQRILKDPPFGIRLGRSAAEHVARNLTRRQCFDSYRALYLETSSPDRVVR
jgi:glycosyltransferase involved in cell wall biosynthesis